MTTRHIRPHKGGRTVTAPSARMTPQERERLDKVLAERNVKHTDWYIDHVNADYAEITGDDTMHTNTMTISRNDYATEAEYRKAYQYATSHYDCKVKVDDGNGGTGWKFFESAEDMRVWKQQK